MSPPYVLVRIRSVNSAELLVLGGAFGSTLDDEGICAVTVDEDDFGLVRDVAGLVRNRGTSEIDDVAVPPEPDRRRVWAPLGGRRDYPDLAHADKTPVDVAPRNVAARGLHSSSKLEILCLQLESRQLGHCLGPTTLKIRLGGQANRTA